jgi:hypothetical protein
MDVSRSGMEPLLVSHLRVSIGSHQLLLMATILLMRRRKTRREDFTLAHQKLLMIFVQVNISKDVRYIFESTTTNNCCIETLESLFYFYRLTGDTTWQDKAYTIFNAINKYCRTDSGFTSLDNVDDASDPGQSNFQESFFFAETMKYSYLIFADPSLISLNEWVFNTEAHPFKLSTPLRIQVAK